MNIALPNSIVILGHEFRIEQVFDGSMGTAADAEEDRDLGVSMGPQYLIRINMTAPEHSTPDRLLNTLVHEIIHSALYITGQDETLALYDDTGHLEEAVVMSITNSLSPLITLREK
jgi:hypothetical protein